MRTTARIHLVPEGPAMVARRGGDYDMVVARFSERPALG